MTEQICRYIGEVRSRINDANIREYVARCYAPVFRDRRVYMPLQDCERNNCHIKDIEKLLEMRK